jgi:hypothetical protein
MLRKTYNLIFILSLLLIVWAACDYQSDSYGDFEQIFVFGDSVLFGTMQTNLEQIFDSYIYTPHSEKSYYLQYKQLEKLNDYNKRRNLLFLVLLDGKDETSKYINNILSDEVKKAVREDRLFYIFREDLFTRNQMAIILIAKDKEALENNLIAFKDAILDEMNRYHFKRLNTIIFQKAEQVALEEYFWDNLGWRIRIQHDYHIVKESETGDFVWLRRFKPDRNIFIYSFPGDISDLNEEYLISVRDSLSLIYFEGDRVSKDDNYAKYEEFNGFPALTMMGVWQNDTHYIGGPFKSFTLYHEPSGKIYMIDILVTAPGKRKKPFLDQLETMARTFTIK